MEEAIGVVERHRATVLWGVTSFIRKLLLRAIESEADFRSVRMVAMTGEASSPEMREELRRLLRRLEAACEPLVFADLKDEPEIATTDGCPGVESGPALSSPWSVKVGHSPWFSNASMGSIGSPRGPVLRALATGRNVDFWLSSMATSSLAISQCASARPSGQPSSSQI